MKALISKIESRESGFRVAQIELDENIFDVAKDFEWVDCPDDLIADSKWFDPSTNLFKDFPEAIVMSQPVSQGAQTL